MLYPVQDLANAIEELIQTKVDQRMDEINHPTVHSQHIYNAQRVQYAKVQVSRLLVQLVTR